MLYKTRQVSGLAILTHSASPNMERNGYSQVGNERYPAYQPGSYVKSSLLNPNLGKFDPYHGLGINPGARKTLPRFGSTVQRAVTGSTRPYVPGSLRDSFINDNPQSMRDITPGAAVGAWQPMPGRRGGMSGLSDDPTQAYGPNLPPVDGPPAPATTTQDTSSSSGIMSTIGNDLGSVLGGIFGTATAVGTSAAETAVAGAIQGTPSTPKPAPAPVAAAPAGSTIMGIKTSSLLTMGGLAAGAALLYKKLGK